MDQTPSDDSLADFPRAVVVPNGKGGARLELELMSHEQISCPAVVLCHNVDIWLTEVSAYDLRDQINQPHHHTRADKSFITQITRQLSGRAH